MKKLEFKGVDLYHFFLNKEKQWCLKLTKNTYINSEKLVNEYRNTTPTVKNFIKFSKNINENEEILCYQVVPSLTNNTNHDIRKYEEIYDGTKIHLYDPNNVCNSEDTDRLVLGDNIFYRKYLNLIKVLRKSKKGKA